ncbi:baseplate J/gp47 family protein [Shinella yambaruensis]|uniref:Baseplate assembly protein n=1 Tax=Shinella yambaruensis TaxID=415996 RepID=A0ABQ5ZI60_9HYPH|nr:baseplate J/gp47 family protein [Shinella yambaruensis]MCJ8027008.1 baseplate J/gp47 family protein [Shinella yambaruensis]MCU7982100.1 baseplate J/gp47 family protein [Shinella yambaruensis]GLR51275.1 baseplate assembly protein [Shinella yambaruensis]
MRFVDLDLSRLPMPDAVEAIDYDARAAERIAELKARLNDKGIAWNVEDLKTDTLVATERHATKFDMLLRNRVNDAALATTLAFARKKDLEHKAAEMGVVRQVIVPADPTANPPVEAVMEDDESLRRRRQLVIEAFSTAGPEGAYMFFALSAHPHALDAAIYDPHSGLCEDGEVLCVIASSQGDGVPADVILDSIADTLDARTIRYAVTAERTRAITRRQKIRPLTDKVIVETCSTLDYTLSIVLKIAHGPAPEAVVAEARKRLDAYIASRRQIGRIISDTAIAAAVHVADASGVALVDDADIVATVAGDPVSDVVPGPKQLARCTEVAVTYEILT